MLYSSVINSWFCSVFLKLSWNFILMSQNVSHLLYFLKNEPVNVSVAGGGSSREREAGVGTTAPPGPGDPAFRAPRRAGRELPTRPAFAGKEGRGPRLGAEYALKLFGNSDFFLNTCKQIWRACAVHVRNTQSGIREFTEHCEFPVLLHALINSCEKNRPVTVLNNVKVLGDNTF